MTISSNAFVATVDGAASDTAVCALVAAHLHMNCLDSGRVYGALARELAALGVEPREATAADIERVRLGSLERSLSANAELYLPMLGDEGDPLAEPWVEESAAVLESSPDIRGIVSRDIQDRVAGDEVVGWIVTGLHATTIFPAARARVRLDAGHEIRADLDPEVSVIDAVALTQGAVGAELIRTVLESGYLVVTRRRSHSGSLTIMAWSRGTAS